MDGDIMHILIAIYHVTADHSPQLLHGDSEFLGSLRFGVLRFPDSGGQLHLLAL
jgi:hypothetical protein